MTAPDELSEFHKRLDDFASRIGKKAEQLEISKKLSPEHQKKMDEMRAKGDALKTRLQEAEPSSWAAMKKELEAEWDILTHSFEHWAEHVDTGFRRRDS